MTQLATDGLEGEARRPNAEWLHLLRGQSIESRRANDELRAMLGRVLERALASRRLDPEAMADLVQEALIRIHDRIDEFRGESRFTTWACAVAIRSALTTLRRAHWKDVSLDSVDLDSANIDSNAISAATPEQAAHASRLMHLLDRVIADDLTSRQRQVILGELAGVPQDHLLERLGVNRNALYKIAHDARRKLRQALERHGVSTSDIKDLFS